MDLADIGSRKEVKRGGLKPSRFSGARLAPQEVGEAVLHEIRGYGLSRRQTVRGRGMLYTQQQEVIGKELSQQI